MINTAEIRVQGWCTHHATRLVVLHGGVTVVTNRIVQLNQVAILAVTVEGRLPVPSATRICRDVIQQVCGAGVLGEVVGGYGESGEARPREV